MKAPTTKFFTNYLKEKTTYIVGGKPVIAENLLKKLNAYDLNVNIVSDFSEIKDTSSNIIYLESLDDFNDEDSAISINKKVFKILKQVGPTFTKEGGCFISVQDTGGDFALSNGEMPNIYLAGLTGLLKTALLEWPKATIKAIDISTYDKSDEEIADKIFNELVLGGYEKEVGFTREGNRISLINEEAIGKEVEHYIDENAVIVVSGGARGVTAVSLIELAKRFNPKLVIFGRTKIEDEPAYLKGAESDAEIKKVLAMQMSKKGEKIIPAELNKRSAKIQAIREIKKNLDAMKKAGSQVEYYPVDITNYEKVKECISEIKSKWGDITGIIHGAGVIADKLIIDKTEDQFDLVFKTKIEGLRSLLKATENEPLKIICLFSSVASRFGNMGQCDYAAANEILNKIANYETKKRGNKCIVRSINWGPWEGGMVTPFLKKQMQQMGIPMIPLDEGSVAFCEELMFANGENAEIIIGPALPEGGFSFDRIKEKDYTMIVNKKAFPYLESHSLKGSTVVPFAVATDWMLRAAKAFSPYSTINRIENIELKRGIHLTYFIKGKSTTIKLKCKMDNNCINTIVERTDKEGVYYKGIVLLNNSLEKPNRDLSSFNSKNWDKWPFNVEEAYEKHLFHGKYLHTIAELLNVSDQGASARLLGGQNLNWPIENYIVDPVLLDGGLQIQTLWSHFLKGRFSLPMSMKGIDIYYSGLQKGYVYVELEKVFVDKTREVSNIYYFNENNDIIMKVTGATTITILSSSIKN